MGIKYNSVQKKKCARFEWSMGNAPITVLLIGGGDAMEKA